MGTAAEKRHMAKVAELDCALCRAFNFPGVQAEVHHIRDGQGMSQRAKDYLTVPLCSSCHRGDHGIHGDRKMLHIAKVSELDLLADTIRRLTDGIGSD